MNTVLVDKKLCKTRENFVDIQTATNIALRRYVIDLISTKIEKLSKKNKFFKEKYNFNFENFQKKITDDEKYIFSLEKNKGFNNWEDDLIDWEFSYKGINDWKQKLQNILIN